MHETLVPRIPQFLRHSAVSNNKVSKQYFDMIRRLFLEQEGDLSYGVETGIGR